MLFSQLPEAEAALVTLDTHDGSILAVVGGYDFNLSHFNRAVQATRQPGSNFKPFIYAAALEYGFTAATVINDAPLVFKDAHMGEDWRPQNNERQFFGPTRLRVGLTKSRNLVSIRLLQSLGISRAIKVCEKFGFDRQSLPRSLSLALGAGTVSPILMATGYASFANGGYKITPHIVKRVVDSQNKVIYEYAPPKEQLQVIDPQTAYIMTNLLQDAILTGTGHAATALHRADLAGKTGTTNNQMDAWYTGFNPNIVTSVWVGFDNSQGLEEYGSQAALPIWMKFMGAALQGTPVVKIDPPPGIVTERIDPATGLLAHPGQGNAIYEVFKENTVPHHTNHHHGGEHNAITPHGDRENEETLF